MSVNGYDGTNLIPYAEKSLVDATPTAGSIRPVSSGGVYDAINDVESYTIPLDSNTWGANSMLFKKTGKVVCVCIPQNMKLGTVREDTVLGTIPELFRPNENRNVYILNMNDYSHTGWSLTVKPNGQVVFYGYADSTGGYVNGTTSLLTYITTN